MRRIDVQFTELHSPLFFNGRNFTTKLMKGGRDNLKLTYDLDEKHLIVEYNDMVAVVPDVHSFQPTNAKDLGLKATKQNAPAPETHVNHPMTTNGIRTAQVETPMSHVQGGMGKGKTGQKAKEA